MSITVQSISEMATSVHVKDVLSVTLNTEYLNHNFIILKQCLIKLQQMENSLGRIDEVDKRLTGVQTNLSAREEELKENCRKIQQLSGNVGDDFMKKMYAVEQKTKNIFSFDDTVGRLRDMDIFMTVNGFKENQGKWQVEIDELKKIKDQFERYVPNSMFMEFKEQQEGLMVSQNAKVEEMKREVRRIDSDIVNFDGRIQAIIKENQLNTNLIKEINFPELMQKNRKFKEESEQKMNDLVIKMKKKVGSNELVALEQTMIQKLDKFLLENEKNKAEKNQTRDALIFLEKRISQIEEFVSQKTSEDDKDGLFTVKKIHCASCTKDLGKFEGKLGQYRPWSIFPCKEMDPEKTGGFGYMSYLDKVQVKKGSTVDDQMFERMNKTAIDRQRQISPKRGSSTARASNLISNFGSQQKAGVSLKDMYFRDLKTQKGERTNSKFFRVKKQSAKPVVSELDKSNVA